MTNAQLEALVKRLERRVAVLERLARKAEREKLLELGLTPPLTG